MALAPILWHPGAAPAYGSATVPASAAPMIAGVEIHVGGAELLPDWHTALGAGERFRRLFGPTFAGDSAVRLVVASLDGNPVSAAAAIGFGRTLGVYAVGTVESARRRGIGRAVTWAAIVAGRSAWGSTLAVLQSSEMGRPLYESMGFVQVGALVEYARRG
jgi:ribosomal protein S18 acetylase RimI-like enzyme